MTRLRSATFQDTRFPSTSVWSTDHRAVKIEDQSKPKIGNTRPRWYFRMSETKYIFSRYFQMF